MGLNKSLDDPFYIDYLCYIVYIISTKEPFEHTLEWVNLLIIFLIKNLYKYWFILSSQGEGLGDSQGETTGQ